MIKTVLSDVLKALFLILLCMSLANGDIVFPSDAGVINITQPPYNADNTGTQDVTAVFQQAVDDVTPGYWRFIYLPIGVYKVSDQIKWGDGGWNQGPVFIGQNRDNTVIRLAENAAGFGVGQRKGVFYTGDGSADNYNNGFRNLTINIGSGNPGACGVQYMSNNEGLMDNVKITSDDGGGKIGLDMGYTDMIGPLLVRDVVIEGFDVGIQIEYPVNSMTLSNVTVRNQKYHGVYIDNQVVSIENLLSENSGTAVYVNRGSLTLLNSTLTGGSTDVPAIINQSGGYLFVRNTTTSGYGGAIENYAGHGNDVPDDYVKEFVSHDVLKLFDASPDHSLNLPIKQPPAVSWETDPARWVNVEDYGATAGGSSDDTAAIQNAIDACTAGNGKNTVYLPNRSTTSSARAFTINGTVYLRGNVKRFLGCAAYIGGTGKVVVTDGSQNVVKIENIRKLQSSSLDIAHTTSRTVIIEACILNNIIGTGTGDLFVNDRVGTFMVLNNPTQRVWCRHLNMEGSLGPVTRITNNGSTLWILGFKTEKNGLKAHTFNGGKTEVAGYFCYPINDAKTTPIFKVEDAAFSLCGMRQAPGATYEDYIQETRSGQTETLQLVDTYKRRVPLFVGHKQIVGNFNGEEGVDIHDHAVVGTAWLSGPGDPRWNRTCDISIPADNMIDTLDLIEFSKYWLQGK